MPVQDQAMAREVTVRTGGKDRVFTRGDLLPPPTNDAEANTRTLLRIGGALRVVEVVYTPDEIAARSRQPGQGPAQASAGAGAAAVVAPQDSADPRGGAPVVLGPKPPAHATKRQWSEYAVEHGMSEAEVETLTRDQLAEKYRDEPGA
jgi:hypothetical protein